MIAPEFTPRKATAGHRLPDSSIPIFWKAEIGYGAHIHLLPRAAGGHEVIVTEPCSTGESYGVFPSLEVAFLEACVIFADILEVNK